MLFRLLATDASLLAAVQLEAAASMRIAPTTTSMATNARHTPVSMASALLLLLRLDAATKILDAIPAHA
jgi:hypothetical protein